jgi:hypothetical protein
MPASAQFALACATTAGSRSKPSGYAILTFIPSREFSSMLSCTELQDRTIGE